MYWHGHVYDDKGVAGLRASGVGLSILGPSLRILASDIEEEHRKLKPEAEARSPKSETPDALTSIDAPSRISLFS